MSNRLYHSPAHIMRPIVQGIQEAPFWVVTVLRQPDMKAGTNAVTVFNAPGLGQEHLMIGERMEQSGVQVMVRASDYNTGFRKADAIAKALDDQWLTSVVLRNQNGEAVIYQLWSFERTTNVICLPVTKITGGYVDEKHADDQIHFVVNGLATLSVID